MTRLFNPFRHSQALVTAVSSVSLFLFGLGAIANRTPTYAQQNLSQPQILDELPPPSYLPNLAAEVVRLGVTESAVNQREAQTGPHVAVGPFDNRKETDRWGSYLRSLGMDARVYFGR